MMNDRRALLQYLETVSCEQFLSDILHGQYDVVTVPTYANRPILNKVIAFLKDITKDSGIAFHAHPSKELFIKMLLMSTKEDFQSVAKEIEKQTLTWDSQTRDHVKVWLNHRNTSLHQALVSALNPTITRPPFFQIQEWRYGAIDDVFISLELTQLQRLKMEAQKEVPLWEDYLMACNRVFVHGDSIELCREEVNELLSPLLRGLEMGEVQQHCSPYEIDQLIMRLWTRIPDSCIVAFANYMSIKSLARSDIYAEHRANFPLLMEPSLMVAIQEEWFSCYNDIQQNSIHKEIEVHW